MSVKLQVLSAYYAEKKALNGQNDRSVAEKLGLVLVVVIPLIWGAAFLAGFNFSLWVFTGLGFLLAVAGLQFPVAGLLGIGMLAALDPVVRGYLAEAGLYRFNTLNYWLIVVIALHLRALLRLTDVHSRILQIFLLLLALELFFSVRVSRGFQVILEIGTVFGLLVYFARSLKEQELFYWLAMVLGVLAGVGGLTFNLLLPRLPYLNPNIWAFLPVTALLIICFGLHQVQQNKRRVLFLLLLFVVNYAWVFLSGSRGNMLTGLVCFLFILWQARRIRWAVVALLIVVPLGYWIISQMQTQSVYALSRIELLFDEQADLSLRTSGRSSLYEGGLEIFERNPLGTGTGSFNDMFAQVDRYRRTKNSHSAWVAVLVENGVPGILLMGAFVLSFAIAGWKQRREDLLSIGLLVTMALGVIFVTKEVNDRGIWLLAAAGIAFLQRQAVLNAFPEDDPRRVLRRYTHLRGGWGSGPALLPEPAWQNTATPAEAPQGD